jgi:alpha-L-fucosidase
MVIWGGSQPDVHFLNNEDGTSPYPLWNVIRSGEGPKWHLPPSTKGWVIPEAENTLSTFAWVPATPERLLQQYYASVGRGANFLQALVPDRRGLIDDAQAKAVAAFGAEVRRRFGQPIAQTDSSNGWLEPGTLETDLGGAKKIAHVVLEEEIAKGQHVLKYAIDVLSDGKWKTVAEGESVGRKRIERLEPAIAAEKVRLRVVQANAIPSISAMKIYDK